MPDYTLEGPKWGSSALGTAGGLVTWAIDSSVPAGFVPVITAAFSDWSHIANITFQQVTSTASSMIDFGSSAIDGLNGTLGVTNYSFSRGMMSSAVITFDSGENWHPSASGVISNGGASLFVTALHEIGHAIGLDHYNAAPAVMNSILAPAVMDLTGSDIDGAHALYGLPPSAPTPSVETNLFGTIAHDAQSNAGQIYALYEGLLGRAPDPLGAEGWAAAFGSGATLRDVTHGILGSSEVTAHINALDNAGFVEQLYETVLDRHADIAGSQGWVNALITGTSREDVADSFVFSTEHLGQLQGSYAAGVFVADATDAAVARLYYGLLDRAPDAGGLQGWESAAHAGTGLETIAQSFLNSAEYLALHGVQTNAQFVEGLYENALGRTPDVTGSQGWLNALSHGASRSEIAVGVTQSGEAQNHLLSHIELGWHLA